MKSKRSAQKEAFCKIPCQNIAVLIHELHELGIETDFWSDKDDERVAAMIAMSDKNATIYAIGSRGVRIRVGASRNVSSE